MARERRITMDWIQATLDNPEQTARRPDGTEHYLRVVPEFGGRTLRVVVNPDTGRVVTVFFDRRMGGRT